MLLFIIIIIVSMVIGSVVLSTTIGGKPLAKLAINTISYTIDTTTINSILYTKMVAAVKSITLVDTRYLFAFY